MAVHEPHSAPGDHDAVGDREAQILTGNLGDQLIPQHEILGDPAQLRTLALLQESLEWFANGIIK